MIYKYLDEKTLQPITDNTLKFATVADLNDPFENLARRKISSEDVQDQIKRAENSLSNQEVFEGMPEDQRRGLIREALQSIKKDYDGSNHNTATLHLQIKLQEATAEKIGILSLTKSCTNSLMWSHYANMHRGYVIGFDEHNEWFHTPDETVKYLQNLSPVTYSKSRFELQQHELNTDTAFGPFFQKSNHWDYEQEQRVLLPLSTCFQPKPKDMPLLYVQKFPEEMIREVVFGFRCQKNTVEKITEALEGLNVKFYRAIPSSISYDMVREEEENYQSIEDYETSLVHKAESAGFNVAPLK